MEVVFVKRFKADGCGRLFSKKKSALNHESVCKCWSNPKNKTCKTCKHSFVQHDSNGMEHDPSFLDTWRYNDCKLGICDTGELKHLWNQTNDSVDINFNCAKWEEF